MATVIYMPEDPSAIGPSLGTAAAGVFNAYMEGKARKEEEEKRRRWMEAVRQAKNRNEALSLPPPAPLEDVQDMKAYYDMLNEMFPIKKDKRTLYKVFKADTGEETQIVGDADNPPSPEELKRLGYTYTKPGAKTQYYADKPTITPLGEPSKARPKGGLTKEEWDRKYGKSRPGAGTKGQRDREFEVLAKAELERRGEKITPRNIRKAALFLKDREKLQKRLFEKYANRIGDTIVLGDNAQKYGYALAVGQEKMWAEDKDLVTAFNEAVEEADKAFPDPTFEPQAPTQDTSVVDQIKQLLGLGEEAKQPEQVPPEIMKQVERDAERFGWTEEEKKRAIEILMKKRRGE